MARLFTLLDVPRDVQGLIGQHLSRDETRSTAEIRRLIKHEDFLSNNYFLLPAFETELQQRYRYIYETHYSKNVRLLQRNYMTVLSNGEQVYDYAQAVADITEMFPLHPPLVRGISLEDFQKTTLCQSGVAGLELICLPLLRKFIILLHEIITDNDNTEIICLLDCIGYFVSCAEIEDNDIIYHLVKIYMTEVHRMPNFPSIAEHLNNTIHRRILTATSGFDGESLTDSTMELLQNQLSPYILLQEDIRRDNIEPYMNTSLSDLPCTNTEAIRRIYQFAALKFYRKYVLPLPNDQDRWMPTGIVAVSSAYRSQAYQPHVYEIIKLAVAKHGKIVFDNTMNYEYSNCIHSVYFHLVFDLPHMWLVTRGITMRDNSISPHYIYKRITNTNETMLPFIRDALIGQYPGEPFTVKNLLWAVHLRISTSHESSRWYDNFIYRLFDRNYLIKPDYCAYIRYFYQQFLATDNKFGPELLILTYFHYYALIQPKTVPYPLVFHQMSNFSDDVGTLTIPTNERAMLVIPDSMFTFKTATVNNIELDNSMKIYIPPGKSATITSDRSVYVYCLADEVAQYMVSKFPDNFLTIV